MLDHTRKKSFRILVLLSMIVILADTLPRIIAVWTEGYFVFAAFVSILWIVGAVGVGVSAYRWLILRKELVL